MTWKKPDASWPKESAASLLRARFEAFGLLGGAADGPAGRFAVDARLRGRQAQRARRRRATCRRRPRPTGSARSRSGRAASSAPRRRSPTTRSRARRTPRRLRRASSACAGSRLSQRVADAAHRVDQPRFPAGLRLPPQVADVHLERIRRRPEVVVPDPLHDQLPRQHLTRIAHEQLEQRVLRPRQLERRVRRAKPLASDDRARAPQTRAARPRPPDASAAAARARARAARRARTASPDSRPRRDRGRGSCPPPSRAPSGSGSASCCRRHAVAGTPRSRPGSASAHRAPPRRTPPAPAASSAARPSLARRDTVALQLERGLDRLAHVRIVVHDQHTPAPNPLRLHQRPFIPGFHAFADPEDPSATPARARRPTSRPTTGETHTAQVEQRNLSRTRSKLRACLSLREIRNRPSAHSLLSSHASALQLTPARSVIDIEPLRAPALARTADRQRSGRARPTRRRTRAGAPFASPESIDSYDREQRVESSSKVSTVRVGLKEV